MHLPFALETKQGILHTRDLLGDNSLAPKSHGRTALMERLTAKRVPGCNHTIFKRVLMLEARKAYYFASLIAKCDGDHKLLSPSIKAPHDPLQSGQKIFRHDLSDSLDSFVSLPLFVPTQYVRRQPADKHGKSAEIRKCLLYQWMRREFFLANQIQRLSILLLIL